MNAMLATTTVILLLVGVALTCIEVWADRERKRIARSRDLMRRLGPYIHQPRPRTDWAAEMDYGRRRFKFPMEDLR